MAMYILHDPPLTLEYIAIDQCRKNLVDCISAQSPDEVLQVALQLKPLDKILRLQQLDNHGKARSIVDYMQGLVQRDTQLFDTILKALEGAGPWTKRVVDELKQTLSSLQDSVGGKRTTDVGPPMTAKHPKHATEIKTDQIGQERTTDVDPPMTAKHPKLAIEVQTGQTAASGSQSSQLVAFCSRFNLSDDDIKKEVSDDHILQIYPQLEKWKRVAAHLGLTRADIGAIESEARPDEELMRLYMLQKWKEKKTLDRTATYQVLLEALINCTCSKSAVQVGEMLSVHIS